MPRTEFDTQLCFWDVHQYSLWALLGDVANGTHPVSQSSSALPSMICNFSHHFRSFGALLHWTRRVSFSLLLSAMTAVNWWVDAEGWARRKRPFWRTAEECGWKHEITKKKKMFTSYMFSCQLWHGHHMANGQCAQENTHTRSHSHAHTLTYILYH